MKEVRSIQKPKTAELSMWDQVVMYIGIFIGNYFSNFVRDDVSPKPFIVTAIISLIIMPLIYKNSVQPYLQENTKQPLLVRFGLFVQHGVFWDVIIESMHFTSNS